MSFNIQDVKGVKIGVHFTPVLECLYCTHQDDTHEQDSGSVRSLVYPSMAAGRAETTDG